MENARDSDPVSASVESLKRLLQEILARPKVTSHDADEAVEAAQIIADLIRCEERALRLLDQPAEHAETSAAGRRLDGRPLAGLTLHEAARRVLAKAGWPMHVRDLAVRIKIGGWKNPRGKDVKPPQLAPQIAARLPRYPETFRRFAPNTFGLTEWGDNPPLKQRPKPLIGIIKTSGEFSAENIDDELAHYFDDERNQWRS